MARFIYFCSLYLTLFTAIQCHNLTHHVYRILPETEHQLSVLLDLHDNAGKYKLDFWHDPKAVGDFVDLEVRQDYDKFVTNILNQTNMAYYQSVPDLQKLIDSRLPSTSQLEYRTNSTFESTWQRDAPVDAVQYDFHQYHDYQSIRRFMRDLAAKYPEIVRVTKLGHTHEKVPIEALEIGFPKEDESDKPIMWIDGGLHAREWVAPHCAVYFMHRLTNMHSESETIKILVDNIHWIILPVANPDGYIYSWSSRDHDVAMWRKNRSPKKCGNGAVEGGFGGPGVPGVPGIFPPFGGEFPRHPFPIQEYFPKGGVENTLQHQCCKGVDINRNFAFKFGTDEPRNPCHEAYAGTHAFSEPETQAMRDWIMPRQDRIKGYLTLHSYSQAFAYSYAHKKFTYPADRNDLERVAKKAVKALSVMYGTEYSTGSAADIFYTAPGTSFDWAKDVVGIKYSYLIELRPKRGWWVGDEGFFLPKNQLYPAARETWQAVQIVAESVINHSRRLRRRKIHRDQRKANQKQS